METNNEYDEALMRKWEQSHKRGKIIGGLLVVVAGLLFLGRELGMEIPHWVFSWKAILIAISLVMLVKHGFRRLGWLIPLTIASVFLVTDLYPDMIIKPIIWPVLVILLGLFIMFKPRRKWKYEQWRQCRGGRHHRRYAFDQRSQMDNERTESNNADFIESTSVIGGVKKNILSKNFKGGEITNVFGGSEINLMQADFEGVVDLEVTQVFGGTKLIIPAHWEIQSNTTVTVLGSIEDKRPVMPNTGNSPKKVIRLTGTTVFGGIEIHSY